MNGRATIRRPSQMIPSSTRCISASIQQSTCMKGLATTIGTRSEISVASMTVCCSFSACSWALLVPLASPISLSEERSTFPTINLRCKMRKWRLKRSALPLLLHKMKICMCPLRLLPTSPNRFLTWKKCVTDAVARSCASYAVAASDATEWPDRSSTTTTWSSWTLSSSSDSLWRYKTSSKAILLTPRKWCWHTSATGSREEIVTQRRVKAMKLRAKLTWSTVSNLPNTLLTSRQKLSSTGAFSLASYTEMERFPNLSSIWRDPRT